MFLINLLNHHPPVIKHGWLENPSSNYQWRMFHATFDYRRVMFG